MKAERQRKIIELITEKNIETQEQLLAELHKSGFRSTQATISRDIKELQIVKSLDGMGGYRYGIPQKNEHDRFGARFRVIFKECVNSLDYAQNLIVVKTMPGLGNAAGANIDALKMPTVPARCPATTPRWSSCATANPQRTSAMKSAECWSKRGKRHAPSAAYREYCRH